LIVFQYSVSPMRVGNDDGEAATVDATCARIGASAAKTPAAIWTDS
jgi:hypothetical protein